MQCDIVWELGKPVYVFICSEGFSYHEYSTYGEEEHNFQQLHRIDCTGILNGVFIICIRGFSIFNYLSKKNLGTLNQVI